jgi:hypothetical protein
MRCRRSDAVIRNRYVGGATALAKLPKKAPELNSRTSRIYSWALDQSTAAFPLPIAVLRGTFCENVANDPRIGRWL